MPGLYFNATLLFIPAGRAHNGNMQDTAPLLNELCSPFILTE
jgi:hypothetical protein